MLKSYFKIFLRNLRKYKGYTFINVVGFAIGLASCIMITMYVLNELSYDKFYENADRIYRVALHRIYPNREVFYGITPVPLAKTLESDYPEVVHATNFRRFQDVVVKYQDKVFRENRGLLAAPNFFTVFSLPLNEGDPATVLAEPNSIVLTEAIAQKIFGEEDPLGKVLTVMGDRDFTVTGISGNVPSNSHFHFDFIVSYLTFPEAYNYQIWTQMIDYTYVLLRENAAAEALETKFPDMVLKYTAPRWEQTQGIPYKEYQAAGNDYIYFLQPIRGIHLRSKLQWEMEPNSDINYIYIFSITAAFILIIACINFINLSTARSAGRAKEVGIRKVVGAHRRKLVDQFLLESILLSTFSLVIALLFVRLALPQFNRIAGKQLTFGLSSNWLLLPGMIVFALGVGIIAGFYPAFFLSAFRPAAVLKGKLLIGLTNTRIRSGLVVFQFFISTTLIICTIAIHKQLGFLVNKDLGFDKENVLLINRAGRLREQRDAFRQELLSSPDILNVAFGRAPGGPYEYAKGVFEDASDPSKAKPILYYMGVDYEFLDTLKIELVAGRNFSREFGEEENSILINEAAAKAYGWEEAVGQLIIPSGEDETPSIVIGVIKDYHFESLNRSIAPLIIRCWHNGPPNCVRIKSRDIPATIAFIKETWERFVPEEPFECSFLDEDIVALYKAEYTSRTIIQIFSVLAIIIACLGLFGLAAFTAEQRTKEIGIRKVLGISVFGVIGLLSKEFIRWVGISVVMAWPVAWLAVRSWLGNFAYRVHIGVDVFILGGILALLIAMVTVSFQAVKAALTDPVDSLRYE